MSRVNKGYDEEDLEPEDEMTDEEVDNLLKEFDIPFVDFDTTDIKNIGKSLYRGGKAAAYSVPIYGDAFAAASFLWRYFGPFGLRAQVKGFTKKLSELSQVELGEDFLEFESGPETNQVLDSRLNEAVLRLTNLKDYPELNVSYLDIVALEKEYDDINDKLRDVFMSFIGFADAAAAQSGIFLNIGLALLDPEDLAAWIATKYANFIRKLESAGGKNLIYQTASKALSAAGKPLDYLGNLDLLFNIDKLNRLSLINDIFDTYKDVDSEEEKLALGFAPDSATSFVTRAATGQYSDQLSKLGIDAPSLSPDQALSDEKFYHKVFRRAVDFLTEYNTSLSELYEDDDKDLEELDAGPFSVSEEETQDVDEVSAGGVGGVAVPLGKEADGSRTTASVLKKRRKAADIYREDVRYSQNWSNRTSGKIKF